MQRATLIHRIYLRNGSNKKDLATADGFVDGSVFVCPEHNISIPLSHVAYIENLATTQLTAIQPPVTNLKPAVKKLKAPSSND